MAIVKASGEMHWAEERTLGVVLEALGTARALRSVDIVPHVEGRIAQIDIATGAGAESRMAIGTVIIGGLLVLGALTLFLTPVLHSLFGRLTTPRSTVEKAIETELASLGRPKPVATE